MSEFWGDQELSPAELAAFAARLEGNTILHKGVASQRLVLPPQCEVVVDHTCPTKVGSFTSGESGLPCGPDTYVAAETHDDDHATIGRGLPRKLGVNSRREAVALQCGGLSPRDIMRKAKR